MLQYAAHWCVETNQKYPYATRRLRQVATARKLAVLLHRLPFSLELRRALFRYIAQHNRRPESLLLASRNETPLDRHVMLRDVKLACKLLGFTPPVRTLHSFRHSFAVNYLRKGGSVFHLQKVLGHSTLEMTRRYANLVTADLQAVHERVSLLTR